MYVREILFLFSEFVAILSHDHQIRSASAWAVDCFLCNCKCVLWGDDRSIAFHTTRGADDQAFFFPLLKPSKRIFYTVSTKLGVVLIREQEPASMGIFFMLSILLASTPAARIKQLTMIDNSQ